MPHRMYRYVCTYNACPSNIYDDNPGWTDQYVDNRVLGRTIEDRRQAFEELHRTHFHTARDQHKIKRVRIVMK